MAQAYPLLCLSIPGLDMQDWKRFCRLSLSRRIRPRNGILVARRIGRSFICGLVAYRCEVDLAAGRMLQAEHLAVADILDTRPIILALMHALSALGRAQNCSRIHILAAEAEPLAVALQSIVRQTESETYIDRLICVCFTAASQPAPPLDPDQSEDRSGCV